MRHPAKLSDILGYKNAKKNKPLCIFLPKMNAYRKYFDETKYMLL